MDNESAEVISPKFKMWVRPDGIVQLVWAPATVMSFVDAIAAIDADGQAHWRANDAPCWWTLMTPAPRIEPRAPSSHAGVISCRPSLYSAPLR
jgi:hypothetical protein